MNSSTAACHFNGRQSMAFPKRELVMVTVTQEDYAKLKAAGGPHPGDIASALRYYLSFVRKTGLLLYGNSFEWNRGPVAHFVTAMPKDLVAQIRNLPGRFDSHTIEAMRIFFKTETGTLGKASQEFDLAPPRGDSVFATFGALRLLASRMLGYLLLP